MSRKIKVRILKENKKRELQELWKVMADQVIDELDPIITIEDWQGNPTARIPMTRDQTCFASRSESHAGPWKKAHAAAFFNHRTPNGDSLFASVEEAYPPVLFYRTILKHFDKKFRLTGEFADDYNCKAYYKDKPSISVKPAGPGLSQGSQSTSNAPPPKNVGSNRDIWESIPANILGILKESRMDWDWEEREYEDEVRGELQKDRDQESPPKASDYPSRDKVQQWEKEFTARRAGEENPAIDELIDILEDDEDTIYEMLTPDQATMVVGGAFALGVLAPIAWFFTKATLGGLFNAIGKEASARQWKKYRQTMAERERELDEQRKAELILLVEFLTQDGRFDMAMRTMADLIKKRPRSEAKKKQLRKEMRAASIEFNKIVRQIISDNEETLTSKKAETFVNNIREMLHSGELQAMDRAQEFAQTREDPGEEVDSEEYVRLAMEEPPYEEYEGEMQAVRGRAKSAGKLEESRKRKIRVRLGKKHLMNEGMLGDFFADTETGTTIGPPPTMDFGPWAENVITTAGQEKLPWPDHSRGTQAAARAIRWQADWTDGDFVFLREVLPTREDRGEKFAEYLKDDSKFVNGVIKKALSSVAYGSSNFMGAWDIPGHIKRLAHLASTRGKILIDKPGMGKHLEKFIKAFPELKGLPDALADELGHNLWNAMHNNPDAVKRRLNAELRRNEWLKRANKIAWDFYHLVHWRGHEPGIDLKRAYKKGWKEVKYLFDEKDAGAVAAAYDRAGANELHRNFYKFIKDWKYMGGSRGHEALKRYMEVAG